MRGSEGRRESWLYRTTIYVVLIVGALPMVMPFYWMVIASLKTKDRVNAAPPDWLPVVPKHFIIANAQELRVKVLDDGRASGSGVARVKVLNEPDMPVLRLPRDAIQRAAGETRYYASIAERRQRVRPVVEGRHGEMVEVARIGADRQIQIAPDAVFGETQTLFYWNVLGVDVPVTIDRPQLPVDGSVRVFSLLEAPAIDVDPRLVSVGEDMTVRIRTRRGVEHDGVPLEHRETPIEDRIDMNDAAGYWTVRLRCPPRGLAVPAYEIRQASRTRFFADVHGRRAEVKKLGVDPDTGLLNVELVGEPQTLRIQAAALEAETYSEYRAVVLGQDVVVEPETPPAPDGPAVIPVRVKGVLSVVESSERTRAEAPIKPQWVNFTEAWRRQRFDVYLSNTLLIASLVVVGTVLSCGLVGYGFARMRFRGSNILFVLLLATMMIPGQVTSIPTFVLYAKLGWIDTYLPLIIPSFLAGAAFYVFLFRQFMLTIPADLEDSARIDGCGPLATWWLIIMPLSKPIIVTVAVFAFIGAWNDFLGPLLYINSDEKQTIALGLQSFKSAYAYDDPQVLMAASVMMLLPTIVLFFVAQKAFIRGVVVSGVKG